MNLWEDSVSLLAMFEQTVLSDCCESRTLKKKCPKKGGLAPFQGRVQIAREEKKEQNAPNVYIIGIRRAEGKLGTWSFISNKKRVLSF